LSLSYVHLIQAGLNPTKWGQSMIGLILLCTKTTTIIRSSRIGISSILVNSKTTIFMQSCFPVASLYFCPVSKRSNNFSSASRYRNKKDFNSLYNKNILQIWNKYLLKDGGGLTANLTWQSAFFFSMWPLKLIYKHEPIITRGGNPRQ
jgi:hypothetical protein